VAPSYAYAVVQLPTGTVTLLFTDIAERPRQNGVG
jgi:hypothetical protein